MPQVEPAQIEEIGQEHGREAQDLLSAEAVTAEMLEVKVSIDDVHFGKFVFEFCP